MREDLQVSHIEPGPRAHKGKGAHEPTVELGEEETSYDNNCMLIKTSLTAIAGANRGVKRMLLEDNFEFRRRTTSITFPMPAYPDQVQGGTLRTAAEGITGACEVVVDLPRAFEAGETTTVAFEINCDNSTSEGNTGGQFVRQKSFESCITEIRVCFPLDSLPHVIWFATWDGSSQSSKIIDSEFCTDQGEQETIEGQPMMVYRKSLVSEYSVKGFYWDLSSGK